MVNQRVLVDTSIIIEYFRKKNKQNSILYKLFMKYDVVTSVVCYFEFFIGTKERDLDFINKLFRKLEILPFTLTTSQKSVEIFKILKRKNKLIEFRDLFIAATALTHNLQLSTLNKKDFERIPGLKLCKDFSSK